MSAERVTVWTVVKTRYMSAPMLQSLEGVRTAKQIRFDDYPPMGSVLRRTMSLTQTGNLHYSARDAIEAYVAHCSLLVSRHRDALAEKEADLSIALDLLAVTP